MDQSETGRLRKKLNNLLSLKSQLDQHEAILRGVRERSQSWEGAADDTMAELGHLFAELSQTLPEKAIAFDKSANNIDGLLAKIVSARSKVEARIAEISEAIDDKTPETNAADASQGTKPESQATDTRRVFVVYGRNTSARDAMFVFLQAINLDPIEWTEAIQMTNHAAPETGDILDAAFSNARAAVVMITGDEIACLGEQFLGESSPADETMPAPQARPNVLFEMGMAFARFPSRTIIVQFLKTRPISDVIARNAIQFSGDAKSRTELADRLKAAGCLVKTAHKYTWLKAGDFSSAFELPKHALLNSDSAIASLKEQITRLQDNEQRLQTGINTILDQRQEQDNKIEALSATLRERDTENTELRNAQKREQETAKASLHEHQRQLATVQQTIEHLKTQVAEKDTQIAGLDALIAANMRLVTSEHDLNQTEAIDAQREHDLVFTSPDDFLVKIFPHEDSDTKGFILTVINNRLTAIGQYRLLVRTGQSYDSRHNDWRENRLNVFSGVSTQPIPASCTGQNMWLLRKIKSGAELLVGNDNGHPLPWPENDKSVIQTWLLATEVTAQTVSKPNTNPTPLAAVNLKLIVRWKTTDNDLEIKEA